MRFSLSVPLLGAVLSLGIVPTCTARAEMPSSEAEVESRRERAKLEFKRGSQLFSAGRYQKAVAAFMAADRLAPSAALSFNIALAYEQLADTSGALRWYRDYLRRSPRAPNAAAVQARVDELATLLSRSGLQQLTVVSTPGGATVMIDGRAVGVTPFTGDLALGQHRLQLDLPGYREPGRYIALGPNSAQDLDVAMASAPVAAKPAETAKIAGPSPLQQDGTRRFGIAPWFVVGGGVVGVGTAIGFELARRSDEKAAERATNQIDFKVEADAMQRHQTTARVAGGVGAALLMTGTIMLLFNDRAPSAPRMGLDCTFKGCTASATGSF